MAENQPKSNPSPLPFLQTLIKASQDVRNNSIFTIQTPQSAIEALLLLETRKEPIFSPSSSPNLSLQFQTLRTLNQNLKSSNGYGLKAFLRRQITNYRICQLGFEIEAQVQTFIDRECIRTILNPESSENDKLRGLKQLENRLLQGFDGEFQELILRSKLFPVLENFIWDSTKSFKLREQSGFCVVALVKFNREVFVGLILMGSIIQSLISMATEASYRALSSLIRLIKFPVIEEVEISNIIRHCYTSEDLSVRVAAMECICEVAFFGRREVIEAMIGDDLVEKLMELQRLGPEKGEFDGCVRKFAVQIEVGEGLEERERREFKREILKRVKMACVSEAESAAVVAEVLWGSSG